MSIKSVAFLEICHDGWALCLQRYTGVPVDRDIFCHDTNIVYWTSYRDIYDTFTYASTNMGKHCLQLVLTLFKLLVLMHGDFPNKLMRKIHAEQFKMVDTTNACVLPTRLVSCTNCRCPRAIPFLFCCYVTYRIVYRIVTTISGYVSYRG